MHQMTLRQVPDALIAEIRKISRNTGHSVNKTVLSVLEKSLGRDECGARKRDLSELAGTWSKEDAENFSRNIRALSVVDEDLWS